MDVGAWLRELGLAHYSLAFQKNGVGAESIRELTNEDLKDIGVARWSDRKRFLKAIAKLSEPQDATTVRARSPAQCILAALGSAGRQLTKLFSVGFAWIPALFVIIVFMECVHIWNTDLVINPFNVSKELSSRGFTGEVLARQFEDSINSLGRCVSPSGKPLQRSKEAKESDDDAGEACSAESDPKTPELHVPAAGVSVRTLASWILTIFGYGPTTADADVTTSEGKLFAVLRIAGNRITAEVNPSLPQPVSALIGQLALKSSPYLISDAWPFAGAKNDEFIDGEYLNRRHFVASRLARRRFFGIANATFAVAEPTQQVASENRAIAALFYNDWGNTKYELGEMEAAFGKFMRAADLNADVAWPVFNAGLTEFELGRYQKAKRFFEKSRTLDPNDPDIVEMLARTMSFLGEVEGARKLFDSVSAHDLRSSWLKIDLARALYRDGRDDDAREMFENITPRDKDVLLEWGEVLTEIGRFDDAIKLLDEANRLAPELARSWESLGWAHAGKRLWNDSLQHFRRALHFDPEAFDAMAGVCWSLQEMRRHREAGLECAKAAAHPAANNAVLVSYGSHLFNTGSFAKALEYAIRALEKDPNNIEAMALAGPALAGLNRSHEGVSLLLGALRRNKLKPSRFKVDRIGNPWLLLSAVDLLVEAGEIDRAIDATTTVLGDVKDLVPQDSRADLLASKAWALSERGDHDEAVRTAKIATETNRYNSWAWWALGNAVAETANVRKKLAKFDEAYGSFAEALAVDPYFVEALVGWGRALRSEAKLSANLQESETDSKNLLEQSITMLWQAVAADPHLSEGWVELARSLIASGKTFAAVAVAKQAQTFRPNDDELFAVKGETLAARREFENAEAALWQAIERDADDAEHFLILGRVRLQAGDPAGARQCYEIAQEIGGSGQFAKQASLELAALLENNITGHSIPCSMSNTELPNNR